MRIPSRGRSLTFLVGVLQLLAWVAPVGQAARGPTERWVRLRVEGRERLCLVHVPPAYDGARPLPLVLALHAEGANAETAQRMTGFSARADRSGFIVAYPNGSGAEARRGLTWNAGDCCGYAQDRQVDDVAYLRALTDHLRRELKVDPRRIYATGLGNGGMMVYRLACELSDRVAAVAVVGGALMARCEPAQPVSVLVIHGSEDPFVPYHGGKPTRKTDDHERTYPSVADTVSYWVKRNGCQKAPRRTEQRKVVVETYPGGRNDTEVSLITLQGGGHAWPAGAPPEFSATDAALHFFSEHAKGAAP